MKDKKMVCRGLLELCFERVADSTMFPNLKRSQQLLKVKHAIKQANLKFSNNARLNNSVLKPT